MCHTSSNITPGGSIFSFCPTGRLLFVGANIVWGVYIRGKYGIYVCIGESSETILPLQLKADINALNWRS